MAVYFSSSKAEGVGVVGVFLVLSMTLNLTENPAAVPMASLSASDKLWVYRVAPQNRSLFNRSGHNQYSCVKTLLLQKVSFPGITKQHR